MSEQNDLITQNEGNEVEQIDENDRIINSVQSIREKIVGDLMKGGAPKDMEDRTFLTQMLAGLTGTALGNKKIKASEKQASNQAQVVKNLAEAVRMAISSESGARRTRASELREVPKLDARVVPGNTDVGTYPVSTSALMNQEAENP